MKAVNHYLVIERIKDEPTKVGGLILTEQTDEDNRYLKAKVISIGNIVEGIKDSSGDWDNTKALLSIDDLVVYPGAELPVIDAIKLGAPGCISATANINSLDIGEVIKLCHAGKWQEAESLHKKVKKVRLLFQEYAPIPAQKAILAIMTDNKLWNNLRPPFKSMENSKTKILASILEKEFEFKF